MPLELELRPSRLLALLIAGLYTMGAIAVVVLPWPLWLIALLLLGLGADARRVFRARVQLRGGRSVVSLRRIDEYGWALRLATGRLVEAELCADGVVHPWLIVLNFKGATGRYAVVLLRDSADTERLRRLRVALRHGRGMFRAA